jgi:hypothetical protein
MPERPPGWPKDVEPMVLQDLNRLGTDSRNQLFWDGKLVRTRLTLTFPQTVIAILAAIASLATIFTELNNASIYLCGRGVTLLGCPAPVVSAPPTIIPGSPQAPARAP